MKDEYQDARFVVETNPESLPATFAIVTACNPYGVTADETTNALQTQALRTKLSSGGITFFPVTGGSPDMKHSEPGFGCLLARNLAQQLGAEFGQDAIFYVDKGELWLFGCTDRTALHLGLFRDRVLKFL